jgi:hypothetical protein
MAGGILSRVARMICALFLTCNCWLYASKLDDFGRLNLGLIGAVGFIWGIMEVFWWMVEEDML